MKKILMLTILIILVSSAQAAWQWAKSFGGDSMERVWEIVADHNGNLFLTGEFVDTLVVDGNEFPGAGLTDTYLIKLDSAGNLLWANTLISTNDNAGLGIGVDAAGNSYVAGYFVDSLTCQEQSVTGNGLWDVYLAKFNPSGTLLWLKSFGGPLNDIAHGMAVSPEGRVFLSGWFADSITFEDNSVLSSYGGSDVLVASFDTNGNFLWARHAGTPGVEYGYKIACDNANNCYVTGSAGPGSDFSGTLLSGSGMFAAKYDPSGNLLWLAPSQGAMVISIAVQPAVVEGQTGMVCGRVVGSGSIGSFGFASLNGSDDAYWAEFDAITGAWQSFDWGGGTASDKGRDCHYSQFSPLPLIAATFEGNAVFGLQNLSSLGDCDLVLGYGDSQFITAGGANLEIGHAICGLPNSSFAVAGWHFGFCRFGSQMIDSGNDANQNGFVALYDPNTAAEDVTQALPSLKAWPNPFRTETRISSEQLSGSATVFNLKGQRVRVLELLSSERGMSVFSWDGNDLEGKRCQAGIYLIRQGKSSHKVMLLN